MNFCENCGKEISSKKYCSSKCLGEKNYKEYIKRWLEGKETGNRGKDCILLSGHVIRWMHEKYEDRCMDCGFEKKHPRTENSILQIHHIDENPENSKPENLSLLCPTCHKLSDSGDTSKGNGRRYYRQQYHTNKNGNKNEFSTTNVISK